MKKRLRQILRDLRMLWSGPSCQAHDCQAREYLLRDFRSLKRAGIAVQKLNGRDQRWDLDVCSDENEVLAVPNSRVLA
jgi:hypothetical protein